MVLVCRGTPKFDENSNGCNPNNNHQSECGFDACRNMKINLKYGTRLLLYCIGGGENSEKNIKGSACENQDITIGGE